MAKAAKKPTKKPSDENAVGPVKRLGDPGWVTEADLARQVAEILLSGGARVEREPSRGMRGDLLVSRQELGRERRYTIEVVLEINNSKIQEHFSRFRNFIRQSKQPFRDFDEYWLVGYRYSDEPMRKRPENDRHFRVLDLEELRKLFAKPRSRKPASKARTKIGKAVEANEKSIQLAIVGLILQIESQLDSLRNERPNSQESIAARNGRISDYERMLDELNSIRQAVTEFAKGTVKEVEVVKSVTTFKDGLREWWEKGYADIINTTYQSSLFVGGAGLLHLFNCDHPVTLAIAGTLIGKETVVKALKALPRKLF